MQRTSTSRQKSWNTFRSFGSLSTIEDFYQPAVLEKIKKLLDEASRLLKLATLKYKVLAGLSVIHPVLARLQGRNKTDSY
jgi:hypothetical protein